MDELNKQLFSHFQGRYFNRRFLLLATFVSCTLIYFTTSSWTSSSSSPLPTKVPVKDVEAKPAPPAKTFVVASMQRDNISWIEDNLLDWDIRRYIVDDTAAKYTVPKNKGREAMVYLTYIIDNYDFLPDLTVFIHGERYQWHNDDPIYDGVPMLRNLQIPYLLQQGYTNIRCVWTLGCPSELKDFPLVPPSPAELAADPKSAENTQLHFPAAFQALFPNTPLPKIVGVACCAQFALTREKIRERPVEDYKRYRQWLLDTPLVDHVSGRVLEYTWHIIFGMEAVHCPNVKECYCKVFGYCNLKCGETSCGERWPFPPYSTLPNGWPLVGWKGEVKSVEEVEKLRFTAVEGGA